MVTTVIAVQICLLVIVVMLFSRTARGSRLESSWAVGQIWDTGKGRGTGLEGWLMRAKAGWSGSELEKWDAENDKNTRSEAVELQKQVDGWVVAKR